MQKSHLTAIVQPEHLGLRADLVVARLFPQFSRMKIKEWILQGACLVAGKEITPRQQLQPNDVIELQASLEPVISDKPNDIYLEVIYEDADILVINKPAGLIMHPGAGNREGTMLNALLNLDNNLATLPRAGIVHRLDKDTSGVVVIARSQIAYQELVAQFSNRSVQKHYYALVHGTIIAGNTINEPIGRDLKSRVKMAIRRDGKEAITTYTVVTKFQKFTLLDVQIATGRTHQIRVHFAALKKPLAGDFMYGGKRVAPINRQALHAYKLTFMHPTLNEVMEFQASMPEDFLHALNTLTINDEQSH